MVDFDSGHLKSGDYNSDTMTLRIEFTKGQAYDYYRVPQEIYEGLLAADSKSEYFRENIKEIFAYMRVL